MVLSQDFNMHVSSHSLPGEFPDCIPVVSLMDEAKLEDVQIHSESFPTADEPSEDGVFQ